VSVKESAKFGLVTKRKCSTFIFQVSDATSCPFNPVKETWEKRYLFWLFNKQFLFLS